MNKELRKFTKWAKASNTRQYAVTAVTVMFLLFCTFAVVAYFYDVPDDNFDMSVRPSEMGLFDKMGYLVHKLILNQFDARYSNIDATYYGKEFGINVPFGINATFKADECDLAGKDRGIFSFNWGMRTYADYAIEEVGGYGLLYKSNIPKGKYIWWMGIDSNYLLEEPSMNKYYTYSYSAVDHSNSRCWADSISYQYARANDGVIDPSAYIPLGVQVDAFYEDWHTFLAPYLCMFSVKDNQIGVYILKDTYARYSRENPRETLLEYGTWIPLSFDDSIDNMGNEHNNRVWIQPHVTVSNESTGGSIVDMRNVTIHCSMTKDAFEQYIKDPDSYIEIGSGDVKIGLFAYKHSVPVGEKVSFDVNAMKDAVSYNSSVNHIEIRHIAPSSMEKTIKSFDLKTTNQFTFDVNFSEIGAHIFRAVLVDPEGNVLATSAEVKVVVFAEDETAPPSGGLEDGTSVEEYVLYAIVCMIVLGLGALVYRNAKNMRRD